MQCCFELDLKAGWAIYCERTLNQAITELYACIWPLTERYFQGGVGEENVGMGDGVVARKVISGFCQVLERIGKS